jgi:hypothetical protein
MSAPFKLSAPSRVGAFIQARDSGMSVAEARDYSESISRPTAEDAGYEDQLREEYELDWPARSANMGAVTQHRWWRLGNPLCELVHIDKIIADPTIGNWPIVRSALIIAALLSLVVWLSV